MPHTAWPLPIDITALTGAMNVTFGTAYTTSYIQEAIDAVVADFETRTRRSFIPSSSTRYFDGNGTGELEIDEYVTISSVSLVGFFGIPDGLLLTEVFDIEDHKYPKTKLGIYRGSVPALYRLWIDRFPVGRRNVAVSASWGYGANIPEDVWDTVRHQTAGVLINQSMFNPKGFLVKWQEADVTEVNNLMDPFKLLNFGSTYREKVRQYRKPSGYQIRKQHRQIV